MPKIKMLETAPGADGGVFTKTYVKGQEYEVGQSLRDAFVDQQGVAEDVKPAAPKKTPAPRRRKK